MRTLSIAILALISWSLASSEAPAPETRMAAPPLHIIVPEDYGSHPQNWGISQDAEGRILVANVRGILVHDGASWEHVIPHDGFRTQGFVKTRDDAVFVYAQNEFGRLVGDGRLGHQFESLIPETYRTAFDSERVRTALAHQGRIWLNTPSGIWCWCDGTLQQRFRNDQGGFNSLHLIGDQVLVRWNTATALSE